MTVLARLVPDVTLSERAFAARHRALSLLLWVHVPVILVLGYFTGQLSPGHHAPLLLAVLGGVLVCGVIAGVATTQRGRAISTSVGFLLAADALVHAGGGMIDLHFHFFVVIALIGLYQDWMAFALAVVLVATHHFGVGVLAPELVFGGHSGHTIGELLGRALLHAGFVLGMAAAQITYWHFDAAVPPRERGEAGGACRGRRGPAARGRRGGLAARGGGAGQAQAQLDRAEQMAERLEDVLQRTSATGARLRTDADEALTGFEAAISGA